MDEKTRQNKIKPTESILSEIDKIIVQTKNEYREDNDKEVVLSYLGKARTFYSTIRTKLYSDEDPDS